MRKFKDVIGYFRVCSQGQPKRRTPDAWSYMFGLYVIDPDGWRDYSLSWNAAITQDMFISCFNRSTVRISDIGRYKLYAHLFN